MSRQHGAAHGSVNSRRAVCVGTSCLGECSDTTLQGTRHGSANAGSYWVKGYSQRQHTHDSRNYTQFRNAGPLTPNPTVHSGPLSTSQHSVEVYDPASRSDLVRTAGRKG